MKPDRTPLAVLVSGVLIAGAILANGHLERAAQNPARLAPTKAEIQDALGKSMRLYSPPPPNVHSSPVTGTEVTGFQITKVQPSDDGRKVRVSLTATTVDKKSWQTDFVLERDEFGRYVGTLHHNDARAYVSVRN